MAYVLGAVKPHVRAAANSLGAQFGIKTIYGVSSGSVPNSDHPKGLALDFMISNLSGGKAIGDALAAYVLNNMAALGVKYVIWYRRINDGSGWRPYSGPSSHTDHVHVSFNATPGTGTPGGVVPVGNPLIPDSVEKIWGFFKSVDEAITWITDPDNIRRIAMFAAGLILALIGLFRLDNVKAATNAAIKGVKNAKP
jgi:hypothetical protein